MFGGLGFFRNICNVDEGLENAGVQSKIYSSAQEKSPECSPVEEGLTETKELN